MGRVRRAGGGKGLPLPGPALSPAGAWDELRERASRIPAAERRPRIWAAPEAGAMFRLARAARDPDCRRVLARARQWLDEVAGSDFPSPSAARGAVIQ